jgi:predicted  nucleic acid-binding Zn-ribbon protein
VNTIKVKCLRCGHEWNPRNIVNIKKCNKCKTKYWNKEKEKSPADSSVPQAVEYRSWAGMIQRCNNPKNPMYSYYGGKGITVCDRWKEAYCNFLLDMGRKPTNKHTLDRIDNSLGYFPENCKWSTREEQSRNRQSVFLTEQTAEEIRKLSVLGISRTEIAKQFNVSKSVICKVINNITWKHV